MVSDTLSSFLYLAKYCKLPIANYCWWLATTRTSPNKHSPLRSTLTNQTRAERPIRTKSSAQESGKVNGLGIASLEHPNSGADFESMASTPTPASVAPVPILGSIQLNKPIASNQPHHGAHIATAKKLTPSRPLFGGNQTGSVTPNIARSKHSPSSARTVPPNNSNPSLNTKSKGQLFGKGTPTFVMTEKGNNPQNVGSDTQAKPVFGPLTQHVEPNTPTTTQRQNVPDTIGIRFAAAILPEINSVPGKELNRFISIGFDTRMMRYSYEVRHHPLYSFCDYRR